MTRDMGYHDEVTVDTTFLPGNKLKTLGAFAQMELHFLDNPAGEDTNLEIANMAALAGEASFSVELNGNRPPGRSARAPSSVQPGFPLIPCQEERAQRLLRVHGCPTARVIDRRGVVRFHGLSTWLLTSAVRPLGDEEPVELVREVDELSRATFGRSRFAWQDDRRILLDPRRWPPCGLRRTPLDP